MGSSLLINDLFLYQLLSNKSELEKNQQDENDKNSANFVSLPNLYNDFFHEKKFLLSIKNTSNFITINIDEFYDFEKNYIEGLKNSNKKDFIKFIQDQTGGNNQLDTLSSQVKFMILKIKSLMGNKIYSNIDKVLIFNQSNENLEEFCLKTGSFLIAENFNCSGCDYSIDPSKFKSINNYVDFYTCTNCYEILCHSCVQYLKCNNLGCSNCF
jgi:hypothetical protein